MEGWDGEADNPPSTCSEGGPSCSASCRTCAGAVAHLGSETKRIWSDVNPSRSRRRPWEGQNVRWCRLYFAGEDSLYVDFQAVLLTRARDEWSQEVGSEKAKGRSRGCSPTWCDNNNNNNNDIGQGGEGGWNWVSSEPHQGQRGTSQGIRGKYYGNGDYRAGTFEPETFRSWIFCGDGQDVNGKWWWEKRMRLQEEEEVEEEKKVKLGSIICQYWYVRGVTYGGIL